MSSKKLLSVIIPVFNEHECIPEVLSRLIKLREKLKKFVDSELIFVNDGSSDSSLSLLKLAAKTKPYIKVISFSRNFGHQIAITAGIDKALGDYVSVIDADLQDPPELIADMYELALTGYDVVYATRKSRAGESIFKKTTASLFYRLLGYMCDIEIPRDAGDFRLMSRKAVNAFNSLRERHRFVRGMISWVGFRSTSLEYHRVERFAGSTKYPLRKMIFFAMNAILSFSSKPLTLVIRLGLVTVLIGCLGAFYLIYQKLFTNIPVPGFTATIVAILIFSGIQTFLIGVVGEYVVRIFEEVKSRPLYIVDETINF
ncbi:glycosyltransferase family 2 protein [Methylophilaceae bacterium]|nr:glycosyltransferase family 2 protein [Methylophilaceae bacterium]